DRLVQQERTPDRQVGCRAVVRDHPAGIGRQVAVGVRRARIGDPACRAEVVRRADARAGAARIGRPRHLAIGRREEGDQDVPGAGSAAVGRRLGGNLGWVVRIAAARRLRGVAVAVAVGVGPAGPGALAVRAHVALRAAVVVVAGEAVARRPVVHAPRRVVAGIGGAGGVGGAVPRRSPDTGATTGAGVACRAGVAVVARGAGGLELARRRAAARERAVGDALVARLGTAHEPIAADRRAHRRLAGAIPALLDGARRRAAVAGARVAVVATLTVDDEAVATDGDAGGPNPHPAQPAL